MTGKIDDPEFIEERRKDIAAALRAEGIDPGELDEIDSDDALERIGVALTKHDVAGY